MRRPTGGVARRRPPPLSPLLLLFPLLAARCTAFSFSSTSTPASTGLSSWRQLLLRGEDPPIPGVVAVVRYPPRAAGFSRASEDQHTLPLTRANLDPDLLPFRESAGRTFRAGGSGGRRGDGGRGFEGGGGGGGFSRPLAALGRLLGLASSSSHSSSSFSSSSSSSSPPHLSSDWTGGPGLSIERFEDFVAGFDLSVPRHPLGEGNAALVVFRRGGVSAFWLRGRDNHFRFACLKAAVESARSLNFPDTAFLLNIDDFPVCRVDGGAWPREASDGVSGMDGQGGGGAGRRGGGAATGGGGNDGKSNGAGKSNNGTTAAPTGRPLCPFPVLTNYKRWNSSLGGSYETNEVLLPVLNHHYEDAYFFPWAEKREKALMRASQQGCMPANSSRVALAVAAERGRGFGLGEDGTAGGVLDEEEGADGAASFSASFSGDDGGGDGNGNGNGSAEDGWSANNGSARASPLSSRALDPSLVLDAGVVRIDGRDKHLLKRRFSKAGFVPIEEHAKWKFLVSADGCVAQTRLAKVLLANSVVLKEDSPWIEYYYRSLVPWVHYAPFRHRKGSYAGEEGAADGEVVRAVARLKSDDAAAARVAAAGQRFAYRHLGQISRLLYLRRLLVEYNALFGADGRGAMEAWVRGGGPERAVARAAASGGKGRERPSGRGLWGERV
jgi:hypothetical protein